MAKRRGLRRLNTPLRTRTQSVSAIRPAHHVRAGPAERIFAVHAIRRCVVALLLMSGLAACVSDPGGQGERPGGSAALRTPTPNPHQKVGAPYRVGGRLYVPRVDPDYDEIGIASWYGPNFHGKLTANGELFDQDRLTAAHPILPLPSLLRVTNLENGRDVIVRLNDRGPFAADRIIDLSRGTADHLGMRQQGLARVRVEYIGAAAMQDAIVRLGDPERGWKLPASTPSAALASVTPPPSSPAPTTPAAAAPIRGTPAPGAAEPPAYVVEVGTFAEPVLAEMARAQLPPNLPSDIDTRAEGYVLRLGPYLHEFAATEAEKAMQRLGFAAVRIVRSGHGD